MRNESASSVRRSTIVNPMDTLCHLQKMRHRISFWCQWKMVVWKIICDYKEKYRFSASIRGLFTNGNGRRMCGWRTQCARMQSDRGCFASECLMHSHHYDERCEHIDSFASMHFQVAFVDENRCAATICQIFGPSEIGTLSFITGGHTQLKHLGHICPIPNRNRSYREKKLDRASDSNPQKLPAPSFFISPFCPTLLLELFVMCTNITSWRCTQYLRCT